MTSGINVKKTKAVIFTMIGVRKESGIKMYLKAVQKVLLPTGQLWGYIYR